MTINVALLGLENSPIEAYPLRPLNLPLLCALHYPILKKVPKSDKYRRQKVTNTGVKK